MSVFFPFLEYAVLVIMHQTLVVIWNIICCSNIIRSFSKVEFKFCNHIWKQILTFKYMTCYIRVCFTTLPFLPYSKSSLPWKVKNYLVSLLGDPSYLLLFSQKLAIEHVQSQLYLLHTLTFPFFKTEFSTVVQHIPCSPVCFYQYFCFLSNILWGWGEKFCLIWHIFIRVMKTW